MASVAPIATLPLCDEPAYVPVPPPTITTYQDRADVDVEYLIEVTPFVPGAGS